MKPFEAFVEFYNPPNNRKPRIREFFDIAWKNYEVNQTQKKSLFHQVERIKILEWHVNKTMNLGELSLIQQGIAENNMRDVKAKHVRALNDVFFPLHDYNKLYGSDYLKAFGQLLKGKNIFNLEDLIKVHDKKKIDEMDIKARQVTKRSIKNFLTEMFKDDHAERIVESKLVSKKNVGSGKQVEGKAVEEFQRVATEEQPLVYDSNVDAQKNTRLDDIKKEHEKELKEIADIIKHATHHDIVKDENELDEGLDEDDDDEDGDAEGAQGNVEIDLLDDNKAFKKHNLNKKFLTPEEEEKARARKIERHKRNALKRYNNLQQSVLRFNKPIWPLNKIFIIYPFTPWKIAYKSLIHYFGERLSLYFKFTAFYATMILFIMFYALVVYIIDYISYYQDTDVDIGWRNANAILYLILSLVITTWASVFYWIWIRKEREFIIVTGYENVLDDKQRISFGKATIKRSLIDDFVNSKQVNYTLVYLKLFVVGLITIACYAASLGATIGLFYFKNYTVRVLPDENYAYINQNIANGIEILKIIVFDQLFYRLAIRMIMWVNPKYLHEFDNFLILVVMAFSIMNNYFVIILIVFIKSSADSFIQCAEEREQLDNNNYKSYCVVEAEIFFKLYVIVKLIQSIIRFIYTKINERYIANILARQESHINAINKNRASHIQNSNMTDIARSGYKYINTDTLTVDRFNYFELNKIIEKQIYLDIANDSEDFDTTLSHYLEIVLSLTGLFWFGLLFPLSFLLFYITVIVELYIDKQRYFQALRRPSPLGKAALGLWNYIISLVAILAVFSNAYIIAYMYTESGVFGIDAQDDRNVLFIVLVIIGIILSLLVGALAYKDPYRVQFMSERQMFIYNKIMANRITGVAVEAEVAQMKSNVGPWGEIDYEYYDKEREKKKRKILDEANAT